MSLVAGAKLGPYEILERVGAGGMGDVYRARDTRLDRIVALKVSKGEFSERFEREARAIAQLNHPNICTLHDVGPNYLVMEYVEGSPLKGPLPLDQALKYAAQICNALDAAHRKGITHRDLKPANILVTKNAVKLLDFGLAKLSRDPSPAVVSGQQTATMALTGDGQILGTLYYMSPEQLQGSEVGPVSDIFSFGLVLYEMLTGRRAFDGKSQASVIAATLERSAPSIADIAPPALDRLLQRCLEKDPENRWQTARDLKAELEWVAEGSAMVKSPSGPAAALSRWRLILAVIAAGVFSIATAGLAFVHFRETLPPEPLLRYEISAPENYTIHSFAISPDGRYVVMAARAKGNSQLWLRALDSVQSQALPGTEGARYPFWSPDSRNIGFFAQYKLKRIAASGGLPQTLCDVVNGTGGSWGRGDVIVFSPVTTVSGIMRISANGGTPVSVTTTLGASQFPAFLPDGRHFLYLALGAPDMSGIYLGSVDGKESRRVLADISAAVFAPSGSGNRLGHLLFTRESSLMAQPFDGVSGEMSGDALPVAAGISQQNPPFSVSENGTVLYAAAGPVVSSQLLWLDRSGEPLSGTAPISNVRFPSLSPDGRVLAFTRGNDIWLRDLGRGTDTRFTFGVASTGNNDPLWSPHMDRIVFNSSRSGHADLFQRPVEASGQDELLLSTPNPKYPDQWSKDGRYVVYSELDPKSGYDLWVLSMIREGSKGPTPTPFLRTGFNELHGQISPDGRWMAYASDESGANEVYVKPFPAGEGKWRMSTTGGALPHWRADGNELFFLGAEGQMMAVTTKTAVDPKPTFEASLPVELFAANIRTAERSFTYDVTADGKRFVAITSESVSDTRSLNAVINWRLALKK